MIAGVSGGVDSMVMLKCLLEYRKETEINLITAHLNHQLRGQAADLDEVTVQNFCQENDCEFVSKTVNIKEMARKQRISMEMAGREARYQFFREIGGRHTNSLIATAHTADDQVETVLYRIFKGTGINGLQGIRVKRNNIIRPLLFARKTDIYAYAIENNIPYREDHTNIDTTIPRNFIRQTLIPSIKSKINPSVERSILHLSEIFSDLEKLNQISVKKALKKCLLRQTSTEIALDISHLKKLFNSVIFEVIRESISFLHSDPATLDFNLTARISSLMRSGQTGNFLRLSNNITASLNRSELILRKNDSPNWNGFDITPGQSYANTFFNFRTELVSIGEYIADSENKNIEYVDDDKLTYSPLFLRPWQKADRIVPLGSSHSKKISDIFIDQKVVLHKKSHIPILLCGKSIVWVCGHKLSDLYKIDTTTTRVLKLVYKETTL
ncbi:MAG: tRNA lysidine(34) synthetase TilS [Candidatus Marinimicrobia bacterium]|nr:tRNA lysidine(34) synthetase TilS [Candidatus Neomarinimicrobiota bacterium]